MNKDLYIDIVSRTIISRISEEIEQSVGEKLNNSLNKLLLTALPEVISKEITPAFEKMQKEMQKAVNESGRKLQVEIQVEINEIRQQMEQNTKEQNGLLSKVLECDFKELSKQLTFDREGLQKEIAGQNDVVKKTLDTTVKTIKSLIETGVTSRFKFVERSVTEVCSELKEIRDQIKEKSQQQRRLFPKDMYSNLKNLSTEFTTGLESLQKEITHIKDTDRRLLRETIESLKEHMEKDVASRIKTIEESSKQLHETLLKELPEAMPKEAALALEKIQEKMVKAVEESVRKLRNEIEEARQHMHKSSGNQNKMLLNVIEGDLKEIHTQFASGLEGLKKEIVSLKNKSHIGANIMVRLKTVEETGKLLHEEIKGIRQKLEQ